MDAEQIGLEIRRKLLENEKKNFELELATYTGTDPLSVWYKYISWIEQSYQKQGIDSPLEMTVLKCIMKFKEDNRYNQDKRLIELYTKYGMKSNHFYLLHNGKKVTDECIFDASASDIPIRVVMCVLGGKGGFGSMLRAIGAAIEKTTNREACRDLSGRRLRDINEEKRLKEWLDKQRDLDEVDINEKLEKKIRKLLAKPKHEFDDKDYEAIRSELLQNIDESVDEGFKKIKEMEVLGLKRKAQEAETINKISVKRNKMLWIDDGISSSTDTDSDEDTGNDTAEASTSHAVPIAAPRDS